MKTVENLENLTTVAGSDIGKTLKMMLLPMIFDLYFKVKPNFFNFLAIAFCKREARRHVTLPIMCST